MIHVNNKGAGTAHLRCGRISLLKTIAPSLVADPAQGSRHNRGCAVDITLYYLRTGKELPMTGVFDEMSDRSCANDPGGTSLQRWRRNLLRQAMEDQGFTVYEYEWWHFDYKDWQQYPVLNIRFRDIPPTTASGPQS